VTPALGEHSIENLHQDRENNILLLPLVNLIAILHEDADISLRITFRRHKIAI
jgi:hypothetical protein